MLKAKFRDHLRSKTDAAMRNEVFCQFLCHNICVVIQSQCELGIEPVFWGEEALAVVAAAEPVPAAVPVPVPVPAPAPEPPPAPVSLTAPARRMVMCGA
jgi:hypothetical protein